MTLPVSSTSSLPIAAIKHKTTAAWLSVLTGIFGGHRFYLHGFRDGWGWGLCAVSFAGLWGVQRLRVLGLYDSAGLWLCVALGLNFAVCALSGIYYGLMQPVRWNARFNPHLEEEHRAGQTRWATVVALIVALMGGTTALMASLAVGFQKMFESVL